MTTPRQYDLGDLVRVEAQFRNTAGVLTDPATVNFKFKSPAGVTTTYVYGTDGQLTRESAGKYHVDIDGNAVGWWYYRFYSTGSGQAAVEGSFRVNKSNFS